MNSKIEEARKRSLNGTITTWLNVPFKDKDEVKSKGARWNPKIKKWGFTGNKFVSLSKWLPNN